MKSDLRVFLKAIFAGKPNELYVLLWTLPEKESHWFADLEAAIKFAESRSRHDVYAGVGFSRRDYGANKRCIADEVAGLVGFWADLDVRSDAHQKTMLPSTTAQAVQVLPKGLPATFIIHSGNGAQAWWLFRELLVFESDDERRSAAKLAGRCQTLLYANAAAHGWTFDRLSDLARVPRVDAVSASRSASMALQVKHRERPCPALLLTPSRARSELRLDP